MMTDLRIKVSDASTHRCVHLMLHLKKARKNSKVTPLKYALAVTWSFSCLPVAKNSFVPVRESRLAGWPENFANKT